MKKSTGHTIGSHLGVDGDKLHNMSMEFLVNLYKEIKTNPHSCECDALKIIMDIAKTPEEMVVLAYQIGRNSDEVAAKISMIADKHKNN